MVITFFFVIVVGRWSDKLETAFLVFEGIDTAAEITLNEVILGTTNNMFVRYKFPVKDVLKVQISF